MFERIKRIFSRKECSMAKKYDIRVCDIDANGAKKFHEENGVMATSPQELIGIYGACGQEIQILREYQDAESQNYGKQKFIDATCVPVSTEPADETSANPSCGKSISQLRKGVGVARTSSNMQPMYFTVGGIKCKMENGKFYQKQWVKISDAESSEIRIVSDKNNKICPIKDKHIEVLKWIIAEDSEVSLSDVSDKNKKTEGV